MHSGRWRFTFGEHGEDAQVEAGPGDIVSFPIHAFRGFENIGEESGFLWSVLGGDDPGRVLRAPQVFEIADRFGLILLENGALVDTTLGQTPPAGVRRMPVTGAEAIAKLRRMRPEDEDEVIARDPVSPPPGESLVIGEGGVLPPAKGFTVSRLILRAGEQGASIRSDVPEVVFVQSGEAEVVTRETAISLAPGDTMTVSVGLERFHRASGSQAELIVVRGAA